MKIQYRIEEVTTSTDKTLTEKEVVEFGLHLNDLNDTDLTFELEDANRHMKGCSFNDVIASFKAFHNKTTDTFKVCMTSGDMMHKTAKTVAIKRVSTT